ncbi:MAG TPA: cupredoxin domain-containing protein [Gaiellaceae bacterium]|nr:cupredoxin domain-containing protein [Gaiellaceae bacterium]
MRVLLLPLAAVAALAFAAPAPAATTKTVNVYGSTFSPKSVTITEGDTIRWVNRDNDTHQIYARGGQFVSAILKPKQVFRFTFRAAGTYRYVDELHPKLTGTIVVKGAPPTLTLAVSRVYAVAGERLTLSGIVSSHRAGEQVSIFYQPYPAPNPIQRTVILTTAGGAFSFGVAPGVLTTYLASWQGAYSQPATVQVQPRLTMGRNGAWIIHAYGGHGLAGRDVQFQRYNGATGQWVTLRKVELNARSSARIQLTLPRGLNRLRLAMSVNQAGAGLLGATSPELLWRQR